MLKVSVQAKISNKDPLVVFPVFEEYKKKNPLPSAVKKLMDSRIKSKDFKNEAGSTLYTITDSKALPTRILLVGLGKIKEFTPEKAREFGATALKAAQAKKQKKFSIYLTGEFDDFVQQVAEGAILANYSIARYKTGKAKKKIEESFCEAATLISGAKSAGRAAKRAAALAEGVFNTRNFVNDPANICSPAQLEKHARKIAKQIGAKITVFNKKQLEKMGANLILAVNQGSPNGDQAARMVVIDYNPKKSKTVDLAIVGKGIIFDTGGVNLKPTRHIEDMHQDMAGAATMLGAMTTLKKLGVKKRIIGVGPITENSMDGTSYRPSDVIKSYSGKTVEIGNTDAEGRLVLADALNYTAKTYKPKHMVDLATLTGACVVALGEEYGALFGNNGKFQEKIMTSSKNTDEAMWVLPIHPKHEKSMKSDVADLRNDSKHSYHAGASTAAAFLKQFVEKTTWAHMDIAGTAYLSRPKKYEKARASGFGVRLLADLAENI